PPPPHLYTLSLHDALPICTNNSRHLTGHAVDIAALVDGQVRWDWPLYPRIAAAFKQAARELNTPITWGGDWPKLRDGPHFELERDRKSTRLNSSHVKISYA